jgi:hypothetical protein
MRCCGGEHKPCHSPKTTGFQHIRGERGKSGQRIMSGIAQNERNDPAIFPTRKIPECGYVVGKEMMVLLCGVGEMGGGKRLLSCAYPSG